MPNRLELEQSSGRDWAIQVVAFNNEEKTITFSQGLYDADTNKSTVAVRLIMASDFYICPTEDGPASASNGFLVKQNVEHELPVRDLVSISVFTAGSNNLFVQEIIN
jgi:hypothetical protein